MRDDMSDIARSGSDPAEGRPDMGIPGADRQDVPPGPEEDLPERLGERIYPDGGQGVATGTPDVKPDVEVPESTM